MERLACSGGGGLVDCYSYGLRFELFIVATPYGGVGNTTGPKHER